MEFLREYDCQNGNGKDRVIHSRTITHVQGDGFRFCIVAEGDGDRATVMFSHEEMRAIIARYQPYRPVTVAGRILSGYPARMIRSFNRVLERYPHLQIPVSKDGLDPPQ